ncbi:MAG: hypothetical protein H6745_07860 [Deltaproteobacteria bacterium]|nr:hypothetical protein [Deltaproteobacteria bacterium]
MKNLALIIALALPVALLGACGDDDNDTGDADAAVVQDTLPADTGGADTVIISPTDVVPGDTGDASTECCPIETPSCDCFQVGGSPSGSGATCGSICDAAPQGWTQGMDENGCPVWTCEDGAACTQSCLAPIDDAGDGDARGSEQ